MKRRRRWLALLLLALGCVLLLPGLSEARVGGGHSYSGGGGSSGGGHGGHGNGDAIIFLIRLCIEYPQIGFPLLGLYLGYLYYNHRAEGSQRLARRRSAPRRRAQSLPWERLREHDRDFSRVILMDLLGRLFVRYQLLQGEGELEGLKPYLSPQVYERLAKSRERNQRLGRTICEVVIGSLNVQRIQVLPNGTQRLSVRFEYNYGVQAKGRAPTHFFAVDTWQLERAKGARSPSPEAAHSLGCPNCGAPVDLAEDGTCAYCDTVIEAGKQSWEVKTTLQVRQQPRHEFNVNLGGGVEEGTELPDVLSPNLSGARSAFLQRYPQFSWSGFEGYGRAVFHKLQEAWSEQRWDKARPYETDQLFHTHRFYLENLKSKGLVNQLRQVKIERSRIVRVESDRYYDAITMRIHAKGLEFTTNAQDQVISGSNKRPREFSEYWTFVRSAGYQGQGQEQDPDHCPNCGAPLEINMSGECAHCDSTITTGQFGWVVSAIEQDEAYAG